MRVDLRFLRERFEYFNRLCFDSKLPTVCLRISSSLRTLGTLRHPRYHSSALRPTDITLSISNRLDLEQNIIEDTIIHEMIHLYIFWFGIKDTSAHGQEFKKIMTGINRRHGRRITITHRGNDEEKKTDRIRKPRLVIISTLNTGERYVTVCSPRYSLSIYAALKKSPLIKSLTAMASYDTVFSNYPSSKTPKIYRIEESKLNNAMERAVILEYHDGKFRPSTYRS